ncbi:hypothetical protein F5B22DRAFT_583822 [Xylaria bambusicola]|uniref:uncharacterized protein n=1 Tax=Xylaria bambusicola TaxID=326684 RepID=UPI002007CC88|nr:uncharacterized protein F5B22DRAFT_583822 [Xylaria bambusicola]KAI0528147.1 hypothetical protein F5B22DRAFT_583822 [Xylaria bambusicola]
MEKDISNAVFESMADTAAASWLAHRASTPNSRQSSSIPQSIPRGTILPPTAVSGPPPPSSAPATLPPSNHTSVAAALDSPASTTPISSSEDRAPSAPPAQASSGIHSDITAWQSALQSLPPEFANSVLPPHPLSQALMNQPTLRPVEWNPYRQQGGFVPRTAHDFSSLMIYVSGQMNPNPCRRCLLRNGPFARCVVSPPAVLGNSSIRHACANCTYQCQYNKCTNEPITEQEKLRAELLRSVVRIKELTPRQPMTRKSDAKEKRERDRPAMEQLNQQRQLNGVSKVRRLQKRAQLAAEYHTGAHQPESRPGPDISFGASPVPFDEKLRRIRACSPQSRRRIAAETLQWQAALATVEAEPPPPASAVPVPRPAAEPTVNQHSRALPNDFTPFQSTPASSMPTLSHGFALDSPPGAMTTSHDTENTFEAMDEDESEDEEESDYGEMAWTQPDSTASIVKAPR